MRLVEFTDDEEYFGIILGINYVPTEFLTPMENLKSQWATINAVMAGDGKTKEEWAAWWLSGNKHPAKIEWSRNDDRMIIRDGHHRYIAAQILKIPLRVTVESFGVQQWEITEFIASNNAELKKYGRKYLK